MGEYLLKLVVFGQTYGNYSTFLKNSFELYLGTNLAAILFEAKIFSAYCPPQRGND
jgi:hypothetical protein